VSARAPKRKPSASPVCYADEKDVVPGYMWAEKPKRASSTAKPRKTTSKKSAKR
jgi:hypothetical protein